MGHVELKWERICDRLEGMSRSDSPKGRRHAILRSLLDDSRACGDPFSVMRILLPKRDKQRAHFKLKEAGLAACLVHALGLAPNSRDGLRLVNWKTSAGSMSGDLSLLACQVISARRQQQLGELSISDVHNFFDKLAFATTREEKILVLRDLIRQTTAQQMKWIVRLILRDMKIGVGEKTILQMFHPDANDAMSICVDLKRVCIQLASLSSRYRRQDLVVGLPLKCQHAKRMNSIEEAWNLMKGKRVVTECKFDGDRILVHKDGDRLWFWSRNSVEHPEYQASIGPLLQQQITSKRCVLDGELLVWDCVKQIYKSRTHNLNRDTARAARKGFETDDLICYVAFDILYEEDHGSLLHLPLHDRQKLLKKSVIQDPPRFITALPDDNGTQWSIIPKSQELLHQFFIDVVQRGDEGIVVKDLGSQWCPDNRDGRWLKVKPDYVNLGADLDLLIIGGYFGEGQSRGQIASYLLAVKDQSKAEEIPSKFLTICKCGGGLSRPEQAHLQKILAPYIVKNTKLIPPSDSGYLITGSPYERPHFWISQPKLSTVLQVSGERRVYPSFTFKAGYTFRFTRAIKVRYDKNWTDCLSIQEFQEMVTAAKPHGNSLVGKCQSLPVPSKKKKYGRTGSGTLIPAYLQGVDHSAIVQKSTEFSDLVFFICKSGKSETMKDWTVRIFEAGGKVSMNLSAHVTHVISAQAQGLDYTTAVASGRDIVCIKWLEECLNSSELLPLTFRHYLHLSDATKELQKDKIDCYGDSYFGSITTEDLSKIFQKMENKDGQNVDMDSMLEVEQKYFGSSNWSIFKGVVLYLLPAIHSTNVDSQTIAQFTLKRLSLEACTYGAEVMQILEGAITHGICFVPGSTHISFKSIYRSTHGNDQQQVLLCEGTNIVSHLWLEDCIREKCILPVEAYNLRGDVILEGFNKKGACSAQSPILCSPQKRQRIFETPPSILDLDLSQTEAPSDSQQLNTRDSMDDLLRILIPSLNSC